jgi:hypothetical protein
MWGAFSGEMTGLLFLQSLLALASAIILGSESRGTRDHIYYLKFETPRFVASYDSQGYGRGIRPRLHAGLTELNSVNRVI